VAQRGGVMRAGTGVDATIAQIVAAILPDFPPLEPAVRAAVQRDVGAYVARQIGSQPRVMRAPLALALVGFQLLPLARYARPFAALSPAQQARYVAWWGAAPLSPMRDLVKLVRGTALWVYFDHPAVAARLPASSAAAG
jgi:hypothetical protein